MLSRQIMNNDYWKQFYKNKHTLRPSSFAKFVRKFIHLKGLSVVDLGCGNGRDSYYLGKDWRVVGIDNAVQPMNIGEKISFIQMDIDKYIFNVPIIHDLVYARFLIHSIDDQLLENILKFGASLIAVEYRSYKDDKSQWVYKDHERKLRTNQGLINLLWENGYELVYFIEAKGLAKYKKEDPLVVRIIAKKI